MTTICTPSQNDSRCLYEPFKVIVAEQGGFLSCIDHTSLKATGTRHEWYDTPAVGQFFDPMEIAKTRKGMLLWAPCGTVYRVAADPTPEADHIRVYLCGDSESSPAMTILPVDGTTYTIIGTAHEQVSSPSPSRSGDSYNFTQVARLDAVTGSAREIHDLLSVMAKEMSFAAVFGARSYGPDAQYARICHTTGGLAFFASRPDGFEVSIAGSKLGSSSIAAAAKLMYEEGGNPDTLICSSAQARGLAGTLLNSGELPIRIVADAALRARDSRAYLVDSTKCGVAFLRSPVAVRHDFGISLIAEYAFEFRDAARSICTISGISKYNPDCK